MNISKKEIKKIQEKEYITIKEFTAIYSFSPTWQKTRRSSPKARIPFIQTKKGGKILYDVEKIKQWFLNNNIS